MTRDFKDLCWPVDQADRALSAFALKTGIGVPGLLEGKGDLNTGSNFKNSLTSIADRLQIDVDEIVANYATVPDALRRGSPIMIQFNFGDETRLLFIESYKRGHCYVFTPHHKTTAVSSKDICSRLREPLEVEFRPKFQALLDNAKVAPEKHESVIQTLLAERLSQIPIHGFWLLRIPLGRPFRQQLKFQKLPQNLITIGLLHTLQYAFLIAGWWVIGKGALNGAIDHGWLLAWILLLVSQIPMQLASTWYQGQFSIGFGCLLKKRLLSGALQADPEKSRKLGTGQLLSRVIDSEAIESIVLQGGFLSLLALFELLLAAVVLSFGAGGIWHAGLLILFTLICAWLFHQQFRLRADWTTSRLRITQSLIEKLIGHRTRLAQQAVERWHDGEDAELGAYELTSKTMDLSVTLLKAFMSRAWLVIGILALVPAVYSSAEVTTGIAIGLGGVLLAYRAIDKGLQGVSSLVTAAIAWKNVGSLFKQGLTQVPVNPILADHGSSEGEPLVKCHNVTFNYPGQNHPAIKNCDFTIWKGDRILLQGESGSGKSTLLKLLTAMYTRHSGVLLLNGLDVASIGAKQWRKHIASAPQFHENHVLTESFAFNLLLGDQWPPSQKKFEESIQICEELGLGDLIQRMPGGMMQMVGATGWQLSHGEKSRLFIARSLLQHSEIVVLDESFAALDPVNLKKAVDCVQKRAGTLLVVAHP